jgi:hypothetical protein
MVLFFGPTLRVCEERPAVEVLSPSPMKDLRLCGPSDFRTFLYSLSSVRIRTDAKALPNKRNPATLMLENVLVQKALESMQPSLTLRDISPPSPQQHLHTLNGLI